MSSRRLFYAVHDTKPPRRSPRAWSPRKPARNWKYRAWIRSLPCAVCGIEPAGEAAHTGSDGGTNLKSSDYSCIPLCSAHHTICPDSYHQLGREAFEKRHGFNCKNLVRELNRLWFKYAKEVK